MSAPVVMLSRRLVVALCLLLIVAVPASASPHAVIIDYGDNGRVDDEHSLADLRSALEVWQENPQYGAFADEVTAAIDRHLLGVAAAESDDPPPPAADAPPRAVPAPPAGPAPSAADDPAPARAGNLGDLEAEVVPASALGSLPSPPVASAESGPPLTLILLAAVALALLVAGAGTAAHRRLRA